MTKTQLEALIGCILLYKNNEIVIQEVTNTFILFRENPSKFFSMDFKELNYEFLFELKIYLTEDDDSLVPIAHYLEHYEIK